MYGGRSSPNKILTWPKGDIPPSIIVGMLLKDEACPEEVDGQLDIKEKAVEKKGDDELPRVWYYTTRGDAKGYKNLYEKEWDLQP